MPDFSKEKLRPIVPEASLIHVLIGRRRRSVNLSRKMTSSNLICIPCQPQSVPKHGDVRVFSTLNLALLNVRSLAGKSLLINDFIIEHKLDIMFLTEIWLGQDNCGAVLNKSAPPNFSFMSEVRMHKKGGGGAFLFRGSLQCNKILFGHPGVDQSL